MQFIKKYEKSLRKLLSTYFLPLLLCYSVMRIIIKTYFTSYVPVITALSVAFMTMLFFIYELIKPRKIIRGIVYFIIGGGVVLACSGLMSLGWQKSGIWFMNWFYISGTSVGQISEYNYTVFIFFSFFLASVVYYFSVIRFRASGLMLAVLLPFIIYGKRALSIADFDMALMVTVYLALVIHGKHSADDMKHDTVFNYSYLITCLIFVTFVGMLTMFIPKPEIESYLENNRNFFDLTINTDLNAFSSLNEESSDRFGASATGELIFKVGTDSNADVLYLRRQTFDEFSNERWRVNQDVYQRMASVPSGTTPSSSAKKYFSVMRNAALNYTTDDSALKKVMDFYSLSQPYSTSNLKNITLYYEDSFRPSYLCAELNFETSDGRNSVPIFRNGHSEAYPTGAYTNELEQISYYYYPVTNDMISFAKDMPFDTKQFRKIVDDMFSKGVITRTHHDDLVDTMNSFTDEEYYEISDRMKELAKQITSGYKNDYQKAEAIVNYFATNGFTYDMDYVPPDESIDYFMFESKTGSCTSYATAMTLMARSVGIPTRYVEGFAAYEKEQGGDLFLVRDSNAHAFVECFVAGVGWMTFDPTVPEYMVIRGNSGTSSGTIKTIAAYLGRAALFLGAGFVIIFIILLDRIDERIFRIRNHSKPLDRRTINLYKRVIKLLNRSHSKKFDGHTPGQIEAYVRDELGGNIELLVVLFQSACFGLQQPTKQQFDEAYEQYKKSWKLIAKGKRPEKPKKVRKKALVQGNL